VLRSAGLVDDRAEGTRYFIDPRGLGPPERMARPVLGSVARKGKGREMNRTITVAAVRRSPMESPMPKMVFVNLPVADVEKSVAFYEAIGFIKDERFSQPGSAGAMVWSDTIVFMILSQAHFADFASKRIVDAKRGRGPPLPVARQPPGRRCDRRESRARRRQGRPWAQAGSRLHVRPQLRGNGAWTITEFP
jgi:catechol 2,3-dioxygenase-like lactoylglutathione lyase family enzyme